MIKKVAVLGIGTAGSMASATLLQGLGSDWEVHTIYSPNIPVVSVGESTVPAFLSILERGCNFNMEEDLQELEGTIKLGTRFINWRDSPFINPLVGGNLTIHIASGRLPAFSLSRLKTLWGDKYQVKEGTILEVTEKLNSVTVTTNVEEMEYEYVVDCRGAPTGLDSSYIRTGGCLDSCILGRAKPLETSMYTDHIATKHGWIFCIPLKYYNSLGFMYNSSITSKEEALASFKDAMPGVEVLNSLKFDSYHSVKCISKGRVLRSGNAYGFFEPLSANSMIMYSAIANEAVDLIKGTRDMEDINKYIRQLTDWVLEFIALHYLQEPSGSINSEFWSKASEWAESVITMPKVSPETSLYSEYTMYNVLKCSDKYVACKNKLGPGSILPLRQLTSIMSNLGVCPSHIGHKLKKKLITPEGGSNEQDSN